MKEPWAGDKIKRKNICNYTNSMYLCSPKPKAAKPKADVVKW